MSDPITLTPPPWTPEQRDQFEYDAARQRHDDLTKQAQAIDAQTIQSIRTAAEVGRANDLQEQVNAAATAAGSSDADMVWELVKLQFTNDPQGAVRGMVGADTIVEWAKRAVAKFRQLHPAPPAA